MTLTDVLDRTTSAPPETPPPSEAPPPPGPPAVGKAERRRWLALVVLLLAAFMDLLDTTIVNVAIPSIREDLDADYASIQWLVAGYLLAIAVGLVTFGRLGDVLGRRRVFVYGVAGFGLASLACGLAPTPTLLVAARIVQGLAAAAMIPQILSTIQATFPREQQRKALSLYATTAGVAVMSGPLMAGLLITELGLSWRTIFLVNVPISVVVVAATLWCVTESAADQRSRLDVGGSALVSLALFTLVFGLIEGREYHWPWWLIALLVLSPALFAAFARYERRQEDRGRSPLVPVRMFRHRPFGGGLVVVLVFFSGVVGFFLAFSVFLQVGLGFDAMESALTTFPSSIGLVVSSLVGQKLLPRPTLKVLALGSLWMALALAALYLVVSRQGGEVSAWEIRPVMFAFGIGMGVTLPSLADVIIGNVPSRDHGAASGIVNTGLQVGNALGVALIGVVLFGSLASQAPDTARAATRQLESDLTAAGIPAARRAAVVEGFTTCFVDRSEQQDPGATPASCEQAAGTSGTSKKARAIDAAVAAASEWARKANFATAIQRALLYEVGVFGAAFVLLLVLPRTPYVGRHKRSRSERRHAAA